MNRHHLMEQLLVKKKQRKLLFKTKHLWKIFIRMNRNKDYFIQMDVKLTILRVNELHFNYERHMQTSNFPFVRELKCSQI